MNQSLWYRLIAYFYWEYPRKIRPGANARGENVRGEYTAGL